MDTIFSREAAANALSGAASDTISALLLFPLDLIKTRVQVDKASVGDVVREAVQKHGPLGLWEGVEGKLYQSPQQKLQLFYFKVMLVEAYKKFVLGGSGRTLSTAERLFLDYLAALEGTITTLPLDVTNVRQITSRGAKKASFWATFFETIEQEGFASFYKGWGASAMLCINPAITYVAFDIIKARVLRGRADQSLSTFEAFVTGAVSKIIATSLTFPLIRAKILLNTWGKKHNGEAPPPLLEVMRRVQAEEGWRGHYIGLSSQLSKGVLNAALMLAIKERVDEVVKRLVVGEAAAKALA